MNLQIVYEQKIFYGNFLRLLKQRFFSSVFFYKNSTNLQLLQCNIDVPESFEKLQLQKLATIEFFRSKSRSKFYLCPIV